MGFCSGDGATRVRSNAQYTFSLPNDPDGLTPELRSFRDACAQGVRQAISTMSALEHQLSMEQARRQQAEQDCKVLLAAVHAERGLQQMSAGPLAEDTARLVALGGGNAIPLAELDKANAAAATIQAHFRGMSARKGYSDRLNQILAGVDPELGTDATWASGQRSGAGATAKRPAVAAAATAAAGTDGVPADFATLRRNVDLIEQRTLVRDEAARVDAARDDSEIEQILAGNYAASSAQIIAALTRRCKQLKAALGDAYARLREAELVAEGLKRANTHVETISALRGELEEERHKGLRLQQTIGQLRHIVDAQAYGATVFNVYGQTRPGAAQASGVQLLDDYDQQVDSWQPLVPGAGSPLYAPRTPPQELRPTQALPADVPGFAPAPAAPPQGFSYQRDTPTIPVYTTAPLLSENTPAAATTSTSGAAGAPTTAPKLFNSGVDVTVQPHALDDKRYPDATPLVRCYTVLPLVKEDVSEQLAKMNLQDHGGAGSRMGAGGVMPASMQYATEQAYAQLPPDARQFRYEQHTPMINMRTVAPWVEPSAWVQTAPATPPQQQQQQQQPLQAFAPGSTVTLSQVHA